MFNKYQIVFYLIIVLHVRLLFDPSGKLVQKFDSSLRIIMCNKRAGFSVKKKTRVFPHERLWSSQNCNNTCNEYLNETNNREHSSDS